MYKILWAMFLLGLFLFSPARAQDNNQPVTRQEFEQLKKENAEIKKENTEIKKELAEVKKQETDQVTASDQDAQDRDKQLKVIQDQVSRAQPGLEGFVIAGDAAVGFVAQRGGPSSFNADVSPLILWQPPDKHFLIEAAFDLGIDGSDVNSETTTVTLNLADISYDLCDYFTVGGGLFAVPFGQFHNHFDPPWVNKFVDNPLAFDSIAPVSEVGFFAKGAIPSGTTKWTYDVYAANGPNLVTDDPAAAGQLNFNDYTDLNNNKAFGGRIGFLPCPDMEMGYSLQYSMPNPGGFQNVHAFMQAADIHYKPTVKQLGGQFDFAGEWIWSNVSRATYDPTGALGFGPATFGNYSQGGYGSITYRPTECDNKFIQSMEFLARYDWLQTPLNNPGGERESRWTLGIDYWFTPYIVAKAAYEIDKKKVGQDQNAFIFQIGIGL